MNIIAWRYRQMSLRAEHERIVAAAVIETGEVVPNPRAMPLDPARLRGIPAVCGRGGWGSAIPGSRPGANLR